MIRTSGNKPTSISFLVKDSVKFVSHFFVGLLCLMMVNAAFAADLPRFLSSATPSVFFNQADRFGEIDESHPVAAVYKGDSKLGYIFLNSDFIGSIGYSGKPIHMLVAIDTKGLLQKVVLVEHHEPIVLIGIPEEKITNLLDDYIGRDIVSLARGTEKEHQIDAVSGATVTVMVMDDTILRSAIKVARLYGLGGLKASQNKPEKKAVINLTVDIKQDWLGLLMEGSVRRLKLSVEQVSSAFENASNSIAAKRPESDNEKDTFIELYAALVSVPSIGKSILGKAEYKNLMKRLKPGEHAVVLAGDGLYSFKGSGYVRGGIFDRFQLLQGDNSVRFHDYNHKRLRSIKAVGAPKLKDADLFIIPADISFKPAQEWTIELLVGRAVGPTQKGFLTFNLINKTPDTYLKYLPASNPEKLNKSASMSDKGMAVWQKMWRAKKTEIVVLVIALGILSLIFFFQQWLVKSAKLTERVRISFLLFTLFGLGWYANAQLSVVNILAALNALVTGFDWAYFLMEPLLFILWGSVAVALLFWGRGAYCGWLCPFGALQELMNKLAKKLKVPQWQLPWGLHERLWPIKYLIFFGLFGISLHSLSMAEEFAEVEPFKTVIILNFVREWPFVIFALLMIIPGLFIERFYCRYLCPLGAALAIPGKMRMFEWLKRYKECGKPCQICANDCMVQAIHPEGNINVNECLYCLNCHVLYSDEHRCPVMIKKAAKMNKYK